MFEEFLKIAERLNRIEICPVLVGSLGLEYISKHSFEADDIDILVPGDSRGWDAPDDERIYQWKEIFAIMGKLGYSLKDLHEHELVKDTYVVSFGNLATVLMVLIY